MIFSLFWYGNLICVLSLESCVIDLLYIDGAYNSLFLVVFMIYTWCLIQKDIAIPVMQVRKIKKRFGEGIKKVNY